MREADTPAADDPRLEVSQADAAYESGRYERALALARDAAEHATELSDDLQLAFARLVESNALVELGDSTAAEHAADLALDAFQRRGDDWVIHDLELRDPETDHWALRAASAEFARTESGDVILIHQTELCAKLCPRVWSVLHEHLLRRPHRGKLG